MNEIKLTEIWRYPLKSAKGQSFNKLAIDPRGFRQDRQWMIVDETGKFLTQRQNAQIALIACQINEQTLTLDAPKMHSIVLPVRSIGKKFSVTVWHDQLDACDLGDEIAAWLSEYLGQTARLVQMPPDTLRHVDPNYAQPGDQVGFADAFPFLLISEASLADLNTRLDEALPMNRFRPNLVVSGCQAFEEDLWRRIRIGPIEFEVIKACSRCITTTVNQNTAKRGKEPLTTLLTYRKFGKQIFFGQNLLHRALGELEVGMKVEILKRAEKAVFPQ